MLNFFVKVIFFVVVFMLLFFMMFVQVEEKIDFKVCWLIYVGWMFWGYFQDSGIMKKWVDKYGIDVEIVQINDYVEFINQYMVGEYDGCFMINMDVLFILVGGGVDIMVLIVGDYFNGNDGIILKDKSELVDIKGQIVNLVEFFVLYYLLVCVLDMVGFSECDLIVVNMFDVDMIVVYVIFDVMLVVIWNLFFFEIEVQVNVIKVFDSVGILGEIIDIMMVNMEILVDNFDFGKVLVGVWYEVMGLMVDGDEEVLMVMVEVFGMDLVGYKV